MLLTTLYIAAQLCSSCNDEPRNTTAEIGPYKLKQQPMTRVFMYARTSQVEGTLLILDQADFDASFEFTSYALNEEPPVERRWNVPRHGVRTLVTPDSMLRLDSSMHTINAVLLAGHDGTYQSQIVDTAGMNAFSTRLLQYEAGIVTIAGGAPGERTFDVRFNAHGKPMVQHTPENVAAVLYGFNGAQLTARFIFSDGSARQIDPTAFELADGPGVDSSASFLTTQPNSKPRSFQGAFTESFTVIRGPQGLLLYGDGDLTELPRSQVLDELPNGKPRPEWQANAMIKDGSMLVREGRRQPLTRLGYSTTVTPLDRRRVALLDRDYQRLIILSREE